jgi:hypothetical protein
MDPDMEAQMYSLRWKNYQAGWKSLYSIDCFFIYIAAETVSLFTLQKRPFLYLNNSGDCFFFFIYTTAEIVSLFTLQQRLFIYTTADTVSLFALF